MLKKENRLCSKYEFGKTKRFGTQLEGKYFYLNYYKNPKYQGPSKVGIVVSKRLSNIAVTRNRVKRLYREALRENFDKIGKDLWIVIYPKSNSLRVSYENIASEINTVLSKILSTN